MKTTKMRGTTPEDFLEFFIAWYNDNVADHDVLPITADECYVVWYCYIVGNAKTLISTNRQDHMYYEITYHQEKDTVYVDQYTKIKHDALA